MKNSFRIFHLIKGLGRGGAETLLKEGLAFVDQSRFQCLYGYFLPWKNALVASMEEEGAEVICFNRKNFTGMMLSIPPIGKLLRDREIDLVHCHLPLAGVVGRLAAKFSGIPVVYTEHNVMERYHPWTRRTNLWTWKLQEGVVAVSEEVKSSILNHTGDSVPVTVIPNGIPVNAFSFSAKDREQVRKNYSIPDSAPVIGTIAVLRKQKDLFTWLQAACLILDQHTNARFLIVGDGPLMAELQSVSNNLNLNAALNFCGIQENVVPFYSAMDIYMSSSIFEGLPLTLLEAMAMKLPVVATSVGGMPEVILDGKTGFLVPPSDPAALAEKIALLVASDQKRFELGTAGRLLVEERYGMAKMIRRLENFYLQVLEEKVVN